MHIYLDLENGISGDMLLAALADLGVDFSPLTSLLSSAGVDCTLSFWKEQRAAGPGMRADVAWNEEAQPLRHPADIEAIFQRVEVSAQVREKALAALEALTQAEAAAHQIPVEQVHFHEVGAVDTLVDILGVCWGFEQLAGGVYPRISASPFPWFSGSIECAHGRIPLPAPATAWLMQGKPVRTPQQAGNEARTELVTPTGAALVHALVDSFAGPAGTISSFGTGYGSRPSSGGLRVWRFQEAASDGMDSGLTDEEVFQVECHLDHLTGEELGAAIEALSTMPHVLDTLWLQGIGKKHRPAGLLRVLCLPRHAPEVIAAVLRHTHTLGLRYSVQHRLVLPREEKRAAMTLAGVEQSVAVKSYRLEGRSYQRPEADELRRIAREKQLGMPALRTSAD